MGICDVVIAVPGWYTDIQRRTLLDAASIAGLNTLRLINDSTAVALGYGITKSDLPEPDNPRHVVFVDVGHSSLSVAVVAFSKGQLHIKSTAYDRHFGGRDIDYALVQHFSEQFKTKYRIDVMSNPKATFRLTAGCEKLKKVLSANAEASLNVESIMSDVDASSKLHRDEFESLISHLLERIPIPVAEALAMSGLSLEQVDAIELVGGSTRIPAVRARIQTVFPGKVLSTTLNQDEAIARGATFSCAMLSPTFRVREFSLNDIAPPYTIKVHWDPTPDHGEGDDTELAVFPRGNSIPSTKVLTFHRKEPFEIQASYAEPGSLPGGINPWIARLTVKSLVPSGKETPSSSTDVSIVKVKTRLNTHGVMSFEGAYVEEIEEKTEPPVTMEVDGEQKTAEPPKVKRIHRKRELPVIFSSTSLDSSVLEQFKEREALMHSADKLVMDTEDRKNALEEYVYDTRSKLDDRYASYVLSAEKEKLLVALSEAEDWLYSEEGEEALKSAYVQRLDALKVLGDPIAARYREAEGRGRAIAQLRETANDYLTKATSSEERYAHIDEKDKQSVVEKIATIQKWLEDQVARQAERPKASDPVLTVEGIGKKRDELVYFAVPILTKPKPKPPVIPGATPNGTGTPRTETPDPAAAANAKEKADGEAQGPQEMDID